MTVDFIIQLARNGELHALSDKSITDDVIIGYINLGLIELYKRFNLATKAELIDTVPETPIYSLKSDDVTMILSVFDKDGKELQQQDIVEDTDYDYSIITYNTIMLQKPLAETLVVVYKASPALLQNIDDKVNIPYVMVEALLHYIGYRAHGSVNGNIQAENNTHYTRFDKSCNLLKAEGYAIDPATATHDIRKKGFL